MEVVRAVPLELDLEAELLAAYPMLTRRLTLVLRDGDEAQDIAQAAFARALEHRTRFRGGDVRAWLYTIGLRLALNELRRRERLAALAPDAEPSWAMSSQPDLWIALERLDPRVRAALVLSILDGYTHAEIAGMLGVGQARCRVGYPARKSNSERCWEKTDDELRHPVGRPISRS